MGPRSVGRVVRVKPCRNDGTVRNLGDPFADKAIEAERYRAIGYSFISG